MTPPTRREFIGSVAALTGVGLTSTAMHGATTPLTVGVVARGRPGERTAALFAAQSTLTLTEIAGVRVGPNSSRGPANWKAAANRWLADPNIHAVAVAVPGRWPLRYALNALESGKDVFIDPLRGYSVAELGELSEAARIQGRVVHLALPHRSNPAIGEAFALVRAGAIGSVRSARAVCLRGEGDETDPFGSAGWSARVARAVDLAVWGLGGLTPATVCVAGVETGRYPAAALPDTTLAVFEGDGRVLTLEHSASPGPLPDGIATGAVIEGTSGRLVCDGETATILTPDGNTVRRIVGRLDPVAAFAQALLTRNSSTNSQSLAAVQLAGDAYRKSAPILGPILPALAGAGFTLQAGVVFANLVARVNKPSSFIPWVARMNNTSSRVS